MREPDETVVVNIYRDNYTVYIGRAGRGKDGYFGNSFEIGKDGTRAQVIAKFEADFKGRIENDEVFHRRVHQELEGECLGCFCVPLDCHGRIYKEHFQTCRASF